MTDHPYTPDHSRRNAVRAAAAGALTAGLLGLAPLAHAAQPPAAPTPPPAGGVAAAHDAAAAPSNLETLSRFFARDGAVARSAARPRIEGATVPVYTLAPEFVAGEDGAAVARLEFLASTAVSADGQKASVWTARTGDTWKVVNIATGDDETRYAAEGARKLSGGTVFREPQINAWYVQRGDRVLPLDEDAVKAVGEGGTTVDAYRARVHKAYGDKLPGSAYAKKGVAGGYAEQNAPDSAAAGTGADRAAVAAPAGDGGSPGAGTVAAAGGTALALGLGAVAARRRLRRR
ncbi:hypothetical protein BLA24_28340 [Streptomyces cinnamoneus]|uniref:Gram-positive cocci surface proteins LPxTG domain-containing protein n=1 Tax=Streptomyces cinnamoneus TaxID=53446 RepID=A0A2G1XBP6_STRCJ|nr:hypothetical protein [Streptomyces cinnamoneus]PHQ48630.1 hypothetical protein BLA24_28340 [Streptomyces cinnamoneus]PPT12691.1 hypothetical protein CYQ11_07130 [Streptomyces cinnamoneus]